MKKRLLLFSVMLMIISLGKAQWVIDSTNTAAVNMYAASTSTCAVFSNGTEWNVFNAVTGVHTYGNLTIARTLIDVVSYGDKVYFAGGKYGYFADPQYTKTVNVYNSVTNTWSTLNLSTAREIGGAGAIGNKVVFAGGTGRTDIAGPVNMYKKVDIFDAVTGARTTANLSKARSNIAVGAAGNKIVFAGGWYWDMSYNIVPSNNADIYDVTTGIWTKTTLSKKRENIAVAVVGDLIIFAGGTGNMGDVTNVDIYNASTNSWSVVYMPIAKSAMRSVVIGNNAYFGGGLGGNANDIYVLNTLTNTWSTITMPTNVTGFSLSVINGKLYAAGGSLVPAGTYTDLVQIYDPILNSWSTQNLSIARTGVAATTVGSKGFFAGGTILYGYPTPTNTKRVDIFTAPLRLIAEEIINPVFEAIVYPNPSSVVLNIEIPTIYAATYATLYDLNGRAVKMMNIADNTTSMQVTDLVPGNYLLIIHDETGNRIVKKVMID